MGITMVELITAMLVIGILATLAAPLLTDFTDRFRVKSSAENFYFFAQSARIEAIKRNTNVYLSFTSGDTWCYGANTGSACNCNTPSSCNLGTKTYSRAESITLSSSGFTSNHFYFEGTRGAVNDSGSITFTVYGQSSPAITTSISRLGSLNQCAVGMSSYSAC